MEKILHFLPSGVSVRKYMWPSTSDQYYPDRSDSIDKWFQTSYSANASTIQRIILDIAGHMPSQIIDPFSGAGSTAVAARRLNVPFFGIEIDPILAEISSLKASLSLPDIERLAEVFPPVINLTYLLEATRVPQSRFIRGASLVAILNGPPRGMPKTELISLLSEGVATTPPPNPRSHVICAECPFPTGMEGSRSVH